ncbi:signal peptide peptidase SppA [bacterium]|nr:signal peptide peptidase SppA [bacterium]
MLRSFVMIAILVWLAPLSRAAGIEGLPAETSPTLRVVHLRLAGELSETPVEDPFGFLTDQAVSLKTLIGRLEDARADKEVGAIMITLDGLAAGYGQIEELQRELLRIREAKKPVFIHSDMYDNRSYLLATGAEEISMAPTSLVLLVGLYGERLYIKTMLDKIGVGSDFIKSGPYKSAAEMFTNTGPSPEADQNMNWLFDSMYDRFIDGIAHGRKAAPDKIRKLVDGGPYTADQALKAGLIDKVEPRDRFIARVKDRFKGRVVIDNRYAEKKKSMSLDANNPFAMFSLFSQMSKPQRVSMRPAIGIIYIDGAIMPGYRSQNPFAGNEGAFAGEIRYAIEKAMNDATVKAIVLRIDSPGGSATASEVILNAAQVAHGKKPILVSMGNVAASGGYYVAMAADEIWADNHTLTASIGVFTGKLVTTQMWNKIGFNWVPYRRGQNAGALSQAAPFSETERVKMQQLVDEIYVTFKKHVTDGRGKKLKKPIEDIAAGRVYTGAQALELGLVDKIGGLDAAVEAAAKRVNLTRYDVRVIPEPLNPIEQIFSELGGRRERPSDVSIGTDGESLLAILGKLDPERARVAKQMLIGIGMMKTQEPMMLMPEMMVVR